MNKNRLFFLFFISLVLNLRAQNEIIFTHYMFTPTFYNAAFVGLQKNAELTLQVRSQWVGYATSFDGGGGAPNSQYLLASFPVSSKISGFGLGLINDELGPLQNLMVSIPISKNFGSMFHQFRLGIMPIYHFQILKFDILRFNDPKDPLNIGSRQTQGNFDLNLGLYYEYDNNYYIGFSANNLLQPKFNFGLDSLENKTKIKYNIITGINFQITRNLNIDFSTIVRSDLNTHSFDLNALTHFNSRGWIGTSYRWDEAVIFMCGYSFLPQNKIQIGYSFDLIINDQKGKQFSSQEIFIKFNFKNLVIGEKKEIKTPRFTF